MLAARAVLGSCTADEPQTDWRVVTGATGLGASLAGIALDMPWSVLWGLSWCGTVISDGMDVWRGRRVWIGKDGR